MKRGQKSAFYVYMHCKPDGTLFYVGKGCGKRARDFASRNQHHQNIVAQYGRENILVSVIPCESDADACYQEIQLIKAFRGIGYELANQTDGGEVWEPRRRSQRPRLAALNWETGA
jgi:predicted GIY-YIG superfamily endonuclease